MKSIFLISLLMCIALTSFCQIKKGKPAPEISLTNIEGTTVNLSDLKGKVVLIDFWASWCGPCRANNPRLIKLYKKYHDKGFEIFGVSIDNNHSNWKEAVKEDQLEWTQVDDDKGWDASTAKVYNVNAIPASFLIDRDGIMREIDLEGRSLESKIKSLLKK
jgi:peroxiredoxin